MTVLTQCLGALLGEGSERGGKGPYRRLAQKASKLIGFDMVFNDSLEGYQFLNFQALSTLPSLTL